MLPVPQDVGRVRISPAKIVWLWGLIVGALLIGPSFAPGAIAATLALTFVTVCLGHSVGLHRGVIHATYEMSRWVRNALLYCFVHTGLGGPLSWILLHHTRDHWQNESETPPYFAYRHSLAKDFWWNLHCAFEPRDASLYGMPAEQTSDSWLRFLERTWFAHPLALFAAVALVIDPHVAVTLVLCRVAMTILGHWFMGFVSHKYGEVRWDLDGSSEVGRNNLLLGWLSFGEGFHNNHHAHPGSARMGFRWYELDLGWLAVRALAALGLIHDVRAFGRTNGTARANARSRAMSDPPATLRWNESERGIRWSRWIGGRTSR